MTGGVAGAKGVQQVGYVTLSSESETRRQGSSDPELPIPVCMLAPWQGARKGTSNFRGLGFGVVTT